MIVYCPTCANMLHGEPMRREKETRCIAARRPTPSLAHSSPASPTETKNTVDRPEGPGEPLKFFCSTCAYVCDVTRTVR